MEPQRMRKDQVIDCVTECVRIRGAGKLLLEAMCSLRRCSCSKLRRWLMWPWWLSWVSMGSSVSTIDGRGDHRRREVADGLIAGNVLFLLGIVLFLLSLFFSFLANL